MAAHVAQASVVRGVAKCRCGISERAGPSRRDIVLEGIYRASCAAWLETRRGLCPEITLTSLTSRGGNEYLRLLRLILPSTPLSNSATIAEPILIPNSTIAHIWALPSGDHSVAAGVAAYVRGALLDRTYFATMALWNTFLAYVSYLVCGYKPCHSP